MTASVTPPAHVTLDEGEDTVIDLVNAVLVLAEYNIPPDVQELLLEGNPDRGIRPGALAAVLKSRS